jgi:asparagine synthetase B (glutamine-hydrolysing)
VTEVDWHGIERLYRAGDRSAPRLREVVPPHESASWLDRDGVLAAWGERDAPAATIVRGVERVLGRALESVVGESVGWRPAFEAAVTNIARAARAPVVALGGGLDGAAVLAAWRASGIAMPAVATIATGRADYDEVDAACAIAARYDRRCDVVEMSIEAIIDAVPEAALVGETPLYNLHPVTRLVLARELARRGHDVLVTGDGGDAVFRGTPDHDYVPIVAAYTRAYLVHATPYAEPAVIAASIAAGLDRRALSDYIGDDRPKRPRILPAIAVERIANPRRIESLARVLDVPPAIDARWVTLDYLVRDIESAS